MIYWGFIAFFLLEYVRPAEFIPIPPQQILANAWHMTRYSPTSWS